MDAQQKTGIGRTVARRAVIAALVGAVAGGGVVFAGSAPAPQAPPPAASAVVDAGTHGGIQLVGRNGRKIKKLWGKGHGRFETRGRRSAATVTG